MQYKDDVFRNLFPNEDTDAVNRIEASMKAKGYDSNYPIFVWKGIIVDGHTRYDVARKLGLDVLAVELNFANDEEAREYAYNAQVNRRNIADVTRVLALLAANKGKNKRKQADIAKEAGVSTGFVSEIKKVVEKGTPEVLAIVEAGVATPKEAAAFVKQVPNKYNQAEAIAKEGSAAITKKYPLIDDDWIKPKTVIKDPIPQQEPLISPGEIPKPDLVSVNPTLEKAKAVVVKSRAMTDEEHKASWEAGKDQLANDLATSRRYECAECKTQLMVFKSKLVAAMCPICEKRTLKLTKVMVPFTSLVEEGDATTLA